MSQGNENTSGSMHQNVLQQIQFLLENRKTYFKTKKTKHPQLFIDGIIKITAKISEGSEEAIFKLLVSNHSESREICLSVLCFNETKTFIKELNQRFLGGDFVLGSGVKAPQLKDYLLWLKDNYIQSGEERDLILLDFIGFVKPQNQWIFNQKDHVGYEGLLKEEDFFWIIEESRAMKNNATSFLMALSFMIKSFLNGYGHERSETGETRFCMLISNEMSTGKTTSMRILANGQGAISRYLLCAGDGRGIGTSVKLLKDVLERTTMFVMLNDYSASKTLDEFLLHAHEGYYHGSGSSGMKKTRASIMISSNLSETQRLHGRLLKLTYKCSDSYSSSNKVDLDNLLEFSGNNKGYITAWCHHFSSVWFTNEVQSTTRKIDDLLKANFPQVQGRYTRAWATTLTAYILIHLSCNKDVNVQQILEYVFESLDPSMDYSMSKSVEEYILLSLDDTSSPIESWLKTGVSFTDKYKKTVNAVAVSSDKMGKCPDINTKTLGASMAAKYGPLSKDVAVDFKEDGSSKSKKAFKIPEVAFTEDGVKKIFEASGEIYVAHDCHRFLQFGKPEIDIFEDSITVLSRIIEETKAVKRGLPTNRQCNESSFSELLTPNTKRKYQSKSPKSRESFREGYDAKKRLLIQDLQDSNSDSSGSDAS